MNQFLSKLLKNDTNNLFVQLFRYAIVGGVAFVVDYGSLYLLTEFAGFHYQLSACVGFILGLLVNYFISIYWVFTANKAQASGSSRSVEFLFYAIIGIIGLGLNSLIMWFSTELLGIHYLASKLISTALVFIWNFLARRLLMSMSITHTNLSPAK